MSYRLGTEILFGRNGNAEEFQGKGWRSPEANHTWSVGESAQLQLPIAARPGLYLKIKFGAFVHPERLPAQRVTLQLNGRSCGQWVITSTSPQVKIVAIPEQLLNGPFLDLAILTPDAISPAQLGINDDSDPLGVVVTSLCLFDQNVIDALDRTTQTICCRNLPEFQVISAQRKATTELYGTYEAYMCAIHAQQKRWELAGFCEACQQETTFQIQLDDSVDDFHTRLRENVGCLRCGLRNRERHLVAVLRTVLSTSTPKPPTQGAIGDPEHLFLRRAFRALRSFWPAGQVKPTKQIYLYEQTTPLFTFLQRTFPELQFQGSEYLGHAVRPGTVINGIRHEDACSLSFPDQSYDLLIAADVFEHVPDISLAFREAYRVLVGGGRLLFTIPFNYHRYESEQRAQVNGETIVNYLPAQYHGNPIDPKGSLVIYDFAWDIVDRCRAQGFTEVIARHDYGIKAGFLGCDPQFLFVASK